MKLIRDEGIREIMLSVWKKTAEKYGKEIEINDAYIDELEKTIYQFQESSIVESQEYFEKQISVTYAGILCMGILSLAMDVEEKNHSEEGKNKAKRKHQLAIRSLLINITNSYLAVLRLIQEGLDYQARILLKNIFEQTWLTIVLVSRKNLMELYTKIEIENELEEWKSHFSVEKLMEELDAIETEIGQPEIFSAILKEMKLEIFNFYSLYVHHSYYWSVKGSFSHSIKEEDSLNPNTFGMATKDSMKTLVNVNKSLIYFLHIFVSKLEKKQEIKPASDGELWEVFQVLRHGFAQSSARVFEVEVDVE